MAIGNGYAAHKPPTLKVETLAPDRNLLRSQLVALLHQYTADVENASAIQKEYEQLVRDAKRERRAAMARIDKLRELLDEEFPGWDTPLIDEWRTGAVAE